MKTERGKTRHCFLAIGALLLVLLSQPALAVDKHWVGSPLHWDSFIWLWPHPFKASLTILINKWGGEIYEDDY